MNASGKSMPSIRSNAEWIESYWRPLERKLVQLGGDSALRPECDPHIGAIFERGRLLTGSPVQSGGLANECHTNACLLWVRSEGRKSLCTGYALSGGGVWMQHSWCMSLPHAEKPRIFETTCEWQKYFGIDFEEHEAFQFVFATIRCTEQLGMLCREYPRMMELLMQTLERGSGS